MKTKQIYLEDSYLQTLDARIIDINLVNPGEQVLILDQTIFYPMGGGQPTDQGTIIDEEEGIELYQVMIQNGEIGHYVKTTDFFVGDTISMVLNWDRRYKNMRVHSAGHVIDFALFELGYSPTKLSPLKGDHGKKPFIVYQGTLDKDFKSELTVKANEIVNRKVNITSQFLGFEELKKAAIYLQPNLPTDKPLRALTFEGIGTVADGGTQVKNSSEVGEIEISNIEVKDNTTTIYYNLK